MYTYIERERDRYRERDIKNNYEAWDGMPASPKVCGAPSALLERSSTRRTNIYCDMT